MVNIQLPHELSDSESEVTPELVTDAETSRNNRISHLANFCFQEAESPVDMKSRAIAAAQLK